jgi:hypothetical protein
MSTNKKSIYQKLNEARIKFHSSAIKKTGKNAFSGFSYLQLDDFLVRALQIFDEVGLCAVITFSNETAAMTIHDVDGEGKIAITSPMADAPLKGCHPIQQIGAVQSYSRRYLWIAALEIVEHDALDANTGSPANEIDTEALLAEWTGELESCETLDDLRNTTKAGVAAIKKVSPETADKLKALAVEMANHLENK